MGLTEAVKKVVMENYCNFKGRARRSEFWWYCLANTLLSIMICIPMYAILIGMASSGKGNVEAMTTFASVYGLIPRLVGIALLLPSLGVCVRRLHDIGKSGWNLLLGFIPCVGGILLIVWYCQDSERGVNAWGDSPKYPAGDSINSDYPGNTPASIQQ